MCKLLLHPSPPYLPSYLYSNWLHTLLYTTLSRLARAKTGTGKTIAFLLPTIQRLFHPSSSASPSSVPRGAQRSRGVQRSIGTQPYMGVQVLVLSPTRELALQTQSVARSLCTSSSWGSISVVGGTTFSTDQKRLQTERADVLVAVRPSTYLMLLTLRPTLAQVYLSLY
jgi:superfamily II DNA/RNA helicase